MCRKQTIGLEGKSRKQHGSECIYPGWFGVGRLVTIPFDLVLIRSSPKGDVYDTSTLRVLTLPTPYNHTTMICKRPRESMGRGHYDD